LTSRSRERNHERTERVEDQARRRPIANDRTESNDFADDDLDSEFGSNDVDADHDPDLDVFADSGRLDDFDSEDDW
jgi:hypothetical protein